MTLEECISRMESPDEVSLVLENGELTEWLMELQQLRNEKEKVINLLREVKVLLYHTEFVNWKDTEAAYNLSKKMKSIVGRC